MSESIIICLKEARSFHQHFVRDSTENCDFPMDLAISEERILAYTASSSKCIVQTTILSFISIRTTFGCNIFSY